MPPTPETVRVYTTDQDDAALAGVLIRVFDSTGTTFITQNYSALVGAAAYAEFTLDGDEEPITYTIRLSKTGVAFDGLLGAGSAATQAIDVYSPATEAPNDNNWFVVKGQTFAHPASTDPRLCLCSGFFKDCSGRPYAALDIAFIAQFKPAIVDGDAVMGERVDLRTDANGYAQVNLYRNGEYRATVQSLEDFTRQIFVPDRASVNLPDLIFPVVKSIAWGVSSLSLSVGEADDVFPVITASDYHVLQTPALEDVLYTIEDETVASLQKMHDRLVITGVAPGTTRLLASRLDQTVVVIPDTGITYTPLDITIT